MDPCKVSDLRTYMKMCKQDPSVLHTEKLRVLGSRWRAWEVKCYLLLIKLNRKKIPGKKKQILRRRRKTKRQSQQARKVI